MLIYLWHMVPVVIVAIAFYASGCRGRQRQPCHDLAGPRCRERERHHPAVRSARLGEGADGAADLVEGMRLQRGGGRPCG
jgi:hypothetical protein